MPSAKDFIPKIKDLPLGKLTGGAQDDVELALARTIRDMEVQLGQPVDIPKFVSAINERHGLVPADKVADFSANIGHAREYVAHQKPVSVSRAGYGSYKAEGIVESVTEAAQQVGAALSGKVSKPRPT